MHYLQTLRLNNVLTIIRNKIMTEFIVKVKLNSFPNNVLSHSREYRKIYIAMLERGAFYL